MNRFSIEREWLIENHSKKRIALLIVRMPLFNERYVRLLSIGGTLGKLEKRGLDNVFIRFKLKNLAPNDERRIKILLEIERKKNNIKDFGLLTDIPAYLRKSYMLMASHAPRRIRKIAKNIAYKSQTIEDVIRETFEFMKRNFELIDESLNLKEMLITGKGNIETFVSFFVLLCSLVGVPSRKIYGVVAEVNKKYVWAEILTKNGWIEIDPARFSLEISSECIPIKVEEPNSEIPEYRILTVRSPERGLVIGISVNEIMIRARRLLK